MDQTQDTFAKFFLGFFGTILGFLLLPKAAKYFVRRFVLGLVAETVTIILTGLLTEKAIDLIAKQK